MKDKIRIEYLFFGIGIGFCVGALLIIFWLVGVK